MQRAVNLTLNEMTIAMLAENDAEEQLLRNSGKVLANVIASYKDKFPDLPINELLLRVAIEMTANAIEAENELGKIKEECKDLLNF